MDHLAAGVEFSPMPCIRRAMLLAASPPASGDFDRLRAVELLTQLEIASFTEIAFEVASSQEPFGLAEAFVRQESLAMAEDSLQKLATRFGGREAEAIRLLCDVYRLRSNSRNHNVQPGSRDKLQQFWQTTWACVRDYLQEEQCFKNLMSWPDARWFCCDASPTRFNGLELFEGNQCVGLSIPVGIDTVEFWQTRDQRGFPQVFLPDGFDKDPVIVFPDAVGYHAAILAGSLLQPNKQRAYRNEYVEFLSCQFPSNAPAVFEQMHDTLRRLAFTQYSIMGEMARRALCCEDLGWAYAVDEMAAVVAHLLKSESTLICWLMLEPIMRLKVGQPMSNVLLWILWRALVSKDPVAFLKRLSAHCWERDHSHESTWGILSQVARVAQTHLAKRGFPMKRL